MKKEVHSELFSLLLKVYNHTIHTYYRFPQVILYGNHHLEKEEFDQLLAEDMVVQCYADSFGRSYRLTKKAEVFLFGSRKKRRRRTFTKRIVSLQGSLQFL